MGKVLPRSFFNRPTLMVARELLGKYLMRRAAPTRGRSGCRHVAAMITEVEAYDGPHDRASHASRGLTPRTKVMFGPAGHWYVYFTYGMHWMLNVVTGREGYPAAVLIRGVELGNPRRKVVYLSKPPREGNDEKRFLTGPARVTKFFRVGKSFNNKKAIPKNGLWIEDRGARIRKSQIVARPRVGVDYAGPLWAKKRHRFVFVGK